jgi:hypothetical protein
MFGVRIEKVKGVVFFLKGIKNLLYLDIVVHVFRHMVRKLHGFQHEEYKVRRLHTSEKYSSVDFSTAVQKVIDQAVLTKDMIYYR